MRIFTMNIFLSVIIQIYLMSFLIIVVHLDVRANSRFRLQITTEIHIKFKKLLHLFHDFIKTIRKSEVEFCYYVSLKYFKGDILY